MVLLVVPNFSIFYTIPVDVSMDTDNPGNFWSQFTLVVSVMRELGVLSFFMEHSVGSVVRDEVGGKAEF